MKKFFSAFQVLMFSGIGLLLATVVSAAPNTDEPAAALATRNDAEFQKLTMEAVENYQTANEIITDMIEKLDAGQVEKIKPQDFGTSWVAILRLARIGNHLESIGETTGVDFRVRADTLREAWRVAKRKYLEVESSKVNLDAIYLKVSADAMRRKRHLAQVQALINQEKWEEAWKSINEEFEDLELMSCWLMGERRRPLVPFDRLRQTIDPKVHAEYEAVGKARLTKLREQTSPDFDGLLAQLNQAVKDLQAGKDPTLDGQAYSGPEFLQKAGTSWRKLHWQALQSQGIDWSSGTRSQKEESQRLTDLIQQQKEFAVQIIPAFAEIIAADAARTNPADAPRIYAEYLAALAPLLTLSADHEGAHALQTKLDSLAAVSASLSADVKAYDAVTRDLLRWRTRLAAARQKQQASDFTAFQTAALEPLLERPREVLGIFTTGLINKNSQDLGEVALLSSLPRSIHRIKTDLVGRQIILPAATGLNPAKKLVASHYDHRHYATFTLPSGYDEQVAALKADLLVSDELPPLTLKAAMAIAAAERGDLQAAGVTIKRVHVEPLSTRFATLPAVASTLVPLGKLPEEPMTEPSLSQLLLRSDVEPSWVRNQYFFILSQP